MNRSGYGGPKLPKALQDQIGGVPKRRKQFAKQRPAVGLSKKEDRMREADRKPVPKTKVEKRAVQLQPESDTDDAGVLDSEPEEPRRSASPVVSKRAAKAGLSENDAEIAALERKLGKKTKSKPESDGDDDDLGFLLGSDSDVVDDDKSLKRKRPDDAKWLRDKRRKASGVEENRDQLGSASEDDSVRSQGEMDDDDDDDLENPFSEDELSEDDFDDSGRESGDVSVKKQRENPYVAPVVQDTGATTTKYVPPSLRKAVVSDEEALKQLRKQVQGQLNRLSEANILSILQAIETIYEKNARQYVTSSIIDLMVGLVADPSTLNDTFLILHAGFSAALYKSIGIDFGAQLLERLVTAFDTARDSSSEGKEMLNILAFLSNLYQFQVVGSGIIFDYIRLLLDNLSESSTELLLRIVRTSGMQLRQEDPTALKDIVLLLHRNTAKVGEENLSVRTKFMIETINNLKNNRMKTGQGASGLAAEHTARMKKSLGSVKTRSFKSTEPLRITLADIRDTEKKGKWWLVGASYHDPAKLVQNDQPLTSTSSLQKTEETDPAYDSETGMPDLSKLARAQGMNTDVRRAIFVTLLSAVDVNDSYTRLLKLNLKSKQVFEIPRVLIHCVTAEPAYNPYYALVARKFCTDHKLRKAWQFALWDLFRRMGEQADADDDDDDEDDDDDDALTLGSALTLPKLVNLAKLYGTLIAVDALRITLLKILDFTHLREKTSMFLELLLTTVLTRVRKPQQQQPTGDAASRTRDVFLHAHAAPEMVQGLKWFVSAVTSSAELARGKKEGRAVREGCAIAVAALTETPAGGMTTTKMSVDRNGGSDDEFYSDGF
nr:suppressor of glycerol defect protein 1 [Quercus suber]